MKLTTVAMSNEQKLKLKKNLFFKHKTLELIYTMQRFDAETMFTGSLLPAGIDYNPSELNSTIFVINSYKEQFEDIDHNIFEHNETLFDFSRRLRNMLWHKDIYVDHLGELINNKLFKSLISRENWEKVNSIWEENKDKNKISELSISFNIDADAELKLIVIYNNEMFVFDVIRDELDLVFGTFEKSIVSLYNYVYR